MLIRCIIILALILLQLNETISQSCSTNSTVGGNPTAFTSQKDTETGVAIMMRHNEYQYQCCGFIYMWEFYVTSSYPVPGIFYAQVWRGGWGGGGGTGSFTSTLVGYNNVTADGVAIMMRHNEYQYQCCGFIYMWEFYVTSSYPVPGIFYAQVWRGGWGGGGGTGSFTSTLVGYNNVTADVTGYDIEVIPNGQRIRCQNNDYIGIHSTGSFPLTHNSAGNNHDRLKLTGVVSEMTSTYVWAGYSNTDQDYAINSYLARSKSPTIDPISDITYYNDELFIGMYIVSVKTADEDIEDQDSLTLTIQQITNSGTNYFQITGTDNFTIQAIPPVNKYVVTLKVQDPCFRSSTSSFTINILNRPPVINNLPATINILEDTAGDALIFTVNATDTVDPVTCSVTGTSSSTFTIPLTTTQDVYTVSGVFFNYDTKSTYTVTIRCTDGPNNVDGVLTVKLIRNEPPIIYSLPASINISEDLSVTTLLHNLYVNDTEGDAITCTLNPSSSIFDVSLITTSTTEYGIFLTGGTTLNYDTTPSYLLHVQCADRRRFTSGLYTVNLIRNMPPTILNLPMSCNIPEDTQKETLIYSVSVTDPTNDTVTCYISPTSSLFFIQMGANQFQFDIFVRSNPGFSYDTLRSYKLSISCADLRRNDSDYFFIYLIRNQPPKLTNLQGKALASSTMSTKGDAVFTVAAYDRENDPLQFSMTVSGNPPFSINQNTGEVSLTRSIIMESITGYDLSIYVDDGRNKVGPNMPTVLITDINSPPVFKNLPQTVSLLEGISVGAIVFKPEVDDKNQMDVHTFSVSYNPADGAIFFAINKIDGMIITLTGIDYETIIYKTFLLTLTVTDSFMSDTRNLTINILNVNEAPTFTKKSYAFSAAEGNAGTVLQNPYYQCSDPEGDKLIYSFDCGANSGRLNMDKTNGFFSYAVKYDLDVSGTPSNLLCQVYVSDGSYTDTANLNITVIDANDNSPVFQNDAYTFFVLANTAVGTTIGHVKATDADVGRYGTFIYHIEQEAIAYSLFNVSNNNGGINVIAPLTAYPEKSILRFRIYVVDAGGLDTSTNVTIVIPDTSVPVSVDLEDTVLYRTFFTYAPNMAWFVPAMFAVFGAVCMVIYSTGKEVSARKSSNVSETKFLKRKTNSWPRQQILNTNETKRQFPMPRPPRQ